MNLLQFLSSGLRWGNGIIVRFSFNFMLNFFLRCYFSPLWRCTMCWFFFLDCNIPSLSLPWSWKLTHLYESLNFVETGGLIMRCFAQRSSIKIYKYTYINIKLHRLFPVSLMEQACSWDLNSTAWNLFLKLNLSDIQLYSLIKNILWGKSGLKYLETFDLRTAVRNPV